MRIIKETVATYKTVQKNNRNNQKRVKLMKRDSISQMLRYKQIQF